MRIMKLLTIALLLIFGYANCVLEKPQYVKYEYLNRDEYNDRFNQIVQDTIYEKLDAVLWESNIKHYIDVILVSIHKPVLAINIFVNEVGRIFKKGKLVQDLKQKVLNGVVLIVKFSSALAGFVGKHARNKITGYFQGTQPTSTTPMEIGYGEPTENANEYTTQLN